MSTVPTAPRPQLPRATRSLAITVLAGTVALLAAAPVALPGQQPIRARDLGVPLEGTPGPLNAITDVAGVEVGHATIIEGAGRLVVGEGPVRTGVTAVLPRGRASLAPVYAAWFPLNGNGEMTGTTWLDESGLLESPIAITNTHSVGMAHHGMLTWLVENQGDFFWALPVVAETWDGILNDINGFHVRPEHVWEALDDARGGPVTEGAVGGGTGMVCNGFKGGIGTSSRVVEVGGSRHTVGVLVQCNYGAQRLLRIAGVPVGAALLEAGVRGLCRASGLVPSHAFLRGLGRCGEAPPSGEYDTGDDLGSIIIVVATDAPLLPHQLERLVKRATLGLGRVGSIATNGSGDIFVAFSTTGYDPATGATSNAGAGIPNDAMDPLFGATVQATEEAIVNAMVAAETMTGADDVRVLALPHDRLREILARHRRVDGEGAEE